MDAFTLFPINMLGTKYYTISYAMYPVISIVATQPGTTTINVLWRHNIGYVEYNGQYYASGDTLTESLEQYQVMYFFGQVEY